MHTENKIQNSVNHISIINGQVVVVIDSTYTSDAGSFTSLGCAMSTVADSNDMNKLINDAVNSSYENLQKQKPHFQGVKTLLQQELPPWNSNPQLPQNSPYMPEQKRPPSQVYSKPHSTTRTASPNQQKLISNICAEKGLDINKVLAPYNKDLDKITSAEANQIIQKAKSCKQY